MSDEEQAARNTRAKEMLRDIVDQLYPQMAQGPRDAITLVRAHGGGACPSQWEAYDAEGNFYYLRYRHCYGSVEKAPSEKLWRSGWDAETRQWENAEVVAAFEWGPYEDCGKISLEKFCEMAGIRLALEEA